MISARSYGDYDEFEKIGIEVVMLIKILSEIENT